MPAGADATAARNLTVGMVLDGIPESIAIGLTLLGGGSVSVALVGAVFLSNLPDAIGVAAALLAGGVELRKVLVRFAAIVAGRLRRRARGYAILEALRGRSHRDHPDHRRRRDGRRVVNEMVPIAVRGAGRARGLAAAAGSRWPRSCRPSATDQSLNAGPTCLTLFDASLADACQGA